MLVAQPHHGGDAARSGEKTSSVAESFRSSRVVSRRTLARITKLSPDLCPLPQLGIVASSCDKTSGGRLEESSNDDASPDRADDKPCPGQRSWLMVAPLNNGELQTRIHSRKPIPADHDEPKQDSSCPVSAMELRVVLPVPHVRYSQEVMYALDVEGKSGHDYFLIRYLNGLTIIGLAPTHAALRNRLTGCLQCEAHQRMADDSRRILSQTGMGNQQTHMKDGHDSVRRGDGSLNDPASCSCGLQNLKVQVSFCESVVGNAVSGKKKHGGLRLLPETQVAVVTTTVHTTAPVDHRQPDKAEMQQTASGLSTEASGNIVESALAVTTETYRVMACCRGDLIEYNEALARDAFDLVSMSEADSWLLIVAPQVKV
eukprot:GHVS01040175.1.p1 GENE.GHVS01040175.1~~GHVS01040175.1.p1  ORF type:complete len:372 (+),score=28.50 GHVS01040175.1:1256-2371(+)